MAWQQALAQHPHREWVASLLEGMQNGFRIGLNPTTACRSSTRNHPSAEKHPAVVSEYLQKQVAAGYMLGPFSPGQCSGMVISSLGVVPKSTPGKFRVIIDLSRPDGHSVNDQICRELTHLAYSSIEDAALLMHSLGPSTQLAKIDIRDAYRIVPVCASERPFLAVAWQGGVYVDCQLPFGLASAPAIFSALAEALEWVLRQRGVHGVLHYLDDFLFLGAPATSECSKALAITIATCTELGVPLAQEKIEGPSTSLTFLGIRLCSTPLLLSLPQGKVDSLRVMLQRIVDSKSVHDAFAPESLVGHLVHATKVCPLGKAFLSGLFQVLHGMQHSHGQPRRLNLATRADIGRWHSLLSTWPGVSVQQFLALGQPDRHLFSDASGSWGCGAWSLPHWFQLLWPHSHGLSSIALMELVPIVLAAAAWG